MLDEIEDKFELTRILIQAGADPNKHGVCLSFLDDITLEMFLDFGLQPSSFEIEFIIRDSYNAVKLMHRLVENSINIQP